MEDQYPPPDLTDQWFLEWSDDPKIESDLCDYIARKTTDWCREKAVRWALDHGLATGHADTLEDLLVEITVKMTGST